MTQPNPTPNDRTPVAPMVAIDILQRMQVGIQRYGTPLQSFNGRNALLDAYEEAGDLLQYLKQQLLQQEELFKAIDDVMEEYQAYQKTNLLNGVGSAIAHLANLKRQMSGEVMAECTDDFCSMPEPKKAIEYFKPLTHFEDMQEAYENDA